MILGNGGAARAVMYVLRKLDIDYRIVSRKATHLQLSYNDLSDRIIQKYPLIINTTPVGTYPDVHGSLDLPFRKIGEQHLLYDLIYNPEETEFLRKGREQGAAIKTDRKCWSYRLRKIGKYGRVSCFLDHNYCIFVI